MQRIPSIGIRFAEDLIFRGYYSIVELQNENGAQLTNTYKKKKGHRIDPCVKDQFRQVVHFFKTNDFSQNWWDFTAERKKYRKHFGYPKDRPVKNWHEDLTN